MARRRFSAKQKRDLVRKFERSGRSATAFCREHKVSCQSLRRWRSEWTGSMGSVGSTPFVELEVESAERADPQPAAGPAVELVLGGGMVLRVFASQPERRP